MPCSGDESKGDGGEGWKERWCTYCFLGFRSVEAFELHIASCVSPEALGKRVARKRDGHLGLGLGLGPGPDGGTGFGGRGERSKKACWFCRPWSWHEDAELETHVMSAHVVCSVCWREGRERGVWMGLWDRCDKEARGEEELGMGYKGGRRKAAMGVGESLKLHQMSVHEDRWCGVCQDVVVDDVTSDLKGKEDVGRRAGGTDGRKMKERHMRRLHVRCEVCIGTKLGRQGVGWFRDRQSLSNHQETWCHFCGVALQDQLGKQLHIKCRHQGKCEECAFGGWDGAQSKCNRHAIRTDLYASIDWKALVCVLRDFITSITSITASKKPSPPKRKKVHQGRRQKINPLEELFHIIGVFPDASDAEITRAIRKRRIQTHPDKLKRITDLDEEARAKAEEDSRRVGWAADILLDPEETERYLRELDIPVARKKGGGVSVWTTM